MNWFSRLFDKTGVLGTLIAAMGCASCFPALGSLAAALGLGFLAQFEGLFINTLLPLFAAIALDPFIPLSQGMVPGISRDHGPSYGVVNSIPALDI